MKFNLDVKHLYKKDTKEDKDMFSLKFETYNNKIEGSFEKSDLRHIIEILDNAIS